MVDGSDEWSTGDRLLRSLGQTALMLSCDVYCQYHVCNDQHVDIKFRCFMILSCFVLYATRMLKFLLFSV